MDISNMGDANNVVQTLSSRIDEAREYLFSRNFDRERYERFGFHDGIAEYDQAVEELNQLTARRDELAELVNSLNASYQNDRREIGQVRETFADLLDGVNRAFDQFGNV